MRDAAKQRALGSGAKPDPWFWTAGCPTGEKPEEWSIEGQSICEVVHLFLRLNML